MTSTIWKLVSTELPKLMAFVADYLLCVPDGEISFFFKDYLGQGDANGEGVREIIVDRETVVKILDGWVVILNSVETDANDVRTRLPPTCFPLSRFTSIEFSDTYPMPKEGE